MKKLLLGLLCITYSLSYINAQIITTIAGNGMVGYSGDGGPATAAEFNYIMGLCLDAPGNLYIVDYYNHRIRKVNTSGNVGTFAGGGSSGFGSPATAASISCENSICSDPSGNIYFTSVTSISEIEVVNTSGILNHFAGNGFINFSGDGGPATAAELNSPSGLCSNAAGDVYIADYGNWRVRMVNTFDTIKSIAGNGTSGYSGDGGPATAAKLVPDFVCSDAAGNIYIADDGNQVVRKINTSGTISTFAGNGLGGYSGDGGPATAAEIWTPYGMCADASGNIYITDFSNSRIRKVNTSGIITTFAGTGTAGYSGDGGQATLAELNFPEFVCCDASGTIYVADNRNNRVRRIGSPTAVNEIDGASSCVKLYPNPNNGTFNLSITNLELGMKMQLDVYNSLGEKIHSSIIHNSQSVIDFTGQAIGIYLYKVTDNTGKIAVTGKFVIE